MAASQAAALLDELMGRDRNLAPTEKRAELRWDDPEVRHKLHTENRNGGCLVKAVLVKVSYNGTLINRTI